MSSNEKRAEEQEQGTRDEGHGWSQRLEKNEVEKEIIKMFEKSNKILIALNGCRQRWHDEAGILAVDACRSLCSLLQNEIIFSIICVITLKPVLLKHRMKSTGLLATLNNVISDWSSNDELGIIFSTHV